MATRHVLVLGGTGEARRLAGLLTLAGVVVTTSLAGATDAPAHPAGQVRRGGFGGVEGLADWLRGHRPGCVVDATHPFAARMSGHAAEACALVGVPLVRLERPGWSDHPDADRWTWVDTHEQAARAAATLESEAHPPGGHRDVAAPIPRRAEPSGGSVLLTVGRQSTPSYVPTLARHRVVARVAEARDLAVPRAWLLLMDRGPFTREAEERLFGRHRVGALVTKDSGGAGTAAKLEVARQVGARVIVVRRPPPPPGVPAVAGVGPAARWCRDVLG